MNNSNCPTTAITVKKEPVQVDVEEKKEFCKKLHALLVSFGSDGATLQELESKFREIWSAALSSFAAKFGHLNTFQMLMEMPEEVYMVQNTTGSFRVKAMQKEETDYNRQLIDKSNQHKSEQRMRRRYWNLRPSVPGWSVGNNNNTTRRYSSSSINRAPALFATSSPAPLRNCTVSPVQQLSVRVQPITNNSATVMGTSAGANSSTGNSHSIRMAIRLPATNANCVPLGERPRRQSSSSIDDSFQKKLSSSLHVVSRTTKYENQQTAISAYPSRLTSAWSGRARVRGAFSKNYSTEPSSRWFKHGWGAAVLADNKQNGGPVPLTRKVATPSPPALNVVRKERQTAGENNIKTDQRAEVEVIHKSESRPYNTPVVSKPYQEKNASAIHPQIRDNNIRPVSVRSNVASTKGGEGETTKEHQIPRGNGIAPLKTMSMNWEAKYEIMLRKFGELKLHDD